MTQAFEIHGWFNTAERINSGVSLINQNLGESSIGTKLKRQFGSDAPSRSSVRSFIRKIKSGVAPDRGKFWSKKLRKRFRDLIIIDDIKSCKKIAEILSLETGLQISRGTISGLKFRAGLCRPYIAPTKKIRRSEEQRKQDGLLLRSILLTRNAPIPKCSPLLPDTVIKDGRELQDLKTGECHYPIGVNDLGRHVFCGEKTRKTKPFLFRTYCPKCDILTHEGL